MKILVFGNLLVKKDSLPSRILPKLRKEFNEIEFKEIDATEELQAEGRDLVILDAVEGIDEVRVIEDIDQIKQSKVYSLHDFDLGYNLKLLKKMKLIDSVKIIGVPMRISEKDAINQIQFILRK
jgi:Ni,Fe-hydrogenase maturation factor